MFHAFSKALYALALLLPCSAMADYIHWEMYTSPDPAKTRVMGENFSITGSFNYSLISNTIFDISVRTSTTDGCVACNDFSDGGTGQTYSFPSGQGGVQFMEEYGPDGWMLGREYFMQISGGNGPDGNWIFDVAQPGTHANLDIDHWGLVLLNDPLDPSVHESIGCIDCAYAIGTLVPAPESETYAMLLAGLGILGWKARRKSAGTKDRNQ